MQKFVQRNVHKLCNNYSFGANVKRLFIKNNFSFNSVLPYFVNTDIRKEMYKANVDAQFKKLYIYHMENVSILFADIKVRKLSYKCTQQVFK